jgi:D-glycero-beta-D-manno-heptose-7-phosphate kinase
MHHLSLERTKRILDGAHDVRILVVGDIMLDVYLRGSASRISPEAPVPVVRVDEEWRALGGAANVAANIVALGASCDLIGCIGNDRAGEDLRAELGSGRIGTAGLVQLARPTTVKTRIMARHQQVARYDHEAEADLDADECSDVVARLRSLLGDADAVVLEDYNKGMLTRAVIQGVLSAARDAACPVIVDPKSRHFFDYTGATVFKPNQPELAAALRDLVHAERPEWLEEVRRQIGCEHLLVTLGEEGMALLTTDGDHVLIPTVARAVYDVSGAGDTVTAVLAVALAAGATIIEAAILANHAAGIEVGKAGVATVSADELMRSVAQPAQVSHIDARS